MSATARWPLRPSRRAGGLVDVAARSPTRPVADLVVVPRVAGPHARLGVVWAGLAAAAVVGGPVALVALLAPAAAAAAHQAARSWRRQPRRAAPPLAAAGAGVLPVAALGGPLAVAAAVAGLAVVLAAGALVARAERRAADPVLTGVIALLPGLAGAGPVLLRRGGLVAALVLLAYAAVYDTGAYVVGTGAAHAWEATVAGVLSIGAVTLAVAAVLVPPFRGASPWVLGALAAALASLGPLAGSALLGDRRARAPALRRLDSLLLLGPLWSLAAALLLQE